MPKHYLHSAEDAEHFCIRPLKSHPTVKILHPILRPAMHVRDAWGRNAFYHI